MPGRGHALSCRAQRVWLLSMTEPGPDVVHEIREHLSWWFVGQMRAELCCSARIPNRFCLQINDIIFKCSNQLSEAEPSHLGTINFIKDLPVWRQNVQRMHLKWVLRNVKQPISASKRQTRLLLRWNCCQDVDKRGARETHWVKMLKYYWELIEKSEMVPRLIN